MPTIHEVMEYSGLNFYEVLELPLDIFLSMRKHYTVNKLRQTEEGRQYLADCERLTKTKPDLKAIRELKQKLEKDRGDK